MEDKGLLSVVSESERPVYRSSNGLNLLFNKKKELVELCLKHQINKLYVFGSVLENRFTEKSDYDFLIQFKDIPFDQYTDHYFELHDDLEKLLGRKIDLLTEKSLKNKFFKEKVVSSRLLLYAA